MPKPNFLIIGAAKSGTTTLYQYLRQHPQVFMSPIKETNFFTHDGADGVAPNDDKPLVSGAGHGDQSVADWDSYLALFDGVTDEIAIGEASPGYFGRPKSAQRIARHLPDVKLAAILRHPADQVYSYFLMQARKGIGRTWRVDHLAQQLNDQGMALFEPYLGIGFYGRNLDHYFRRFDRARIAVYLFDDLRDNRQDLLDNLCDFLGVAPFTPVGPAAYHVGGFDRLPQLEALFSRRNPIRLIARHLVPAALRTRVTESIRVRNRQRPPPLPDALRAQLNAHYRADILRLEQLIDRDLSHWLVR